MTENAGCTAGLGGPVDMFGRINNASINCVSATNHNFPGPVGDKESRGLPRVGNDGGRGRYWWNNCGSAQIFESNVNSST